MYVYIARYKKILKVYESTLLNAVCFTAHDLTINSFIILLAQP